MPRRQNLIDRAIANLEGEIAARQHAIDALRASVRNGTTTRRGRPKSSTTSPVNQHVAAGDTTKGTP